MGRGPAESLLALKPVGSYLVRLSVKTWGYTISVKSEFHYSFKGLSRIRIYHNRCALLYLNLFEEVKHTVTTKLNI